MLGLHTIPFGSWETKRNSKKEQLSVWYYRIFNKNFFKQSLCSKTSIFNSSKKELLIILLFLGTMSSNLKQKLQTSIRNSLPQCNIKVILKSTNHLSSLFRFKDVISKELSSHLVYKFSCRSCHATYYGKTERHLNVRSGGHIGLSSRTRNRVTCKPSAMLTIYYCMSIIIVASTVF